MNVSSELLFYDDYLKVTNNEISIIRSRRATEDLVLRGEVTQDTVRRLELPEWSCAFGFLPWRSPAARDPGTNSLAAQASWRGGCEGRKRQAGCRAPPEPEELTTCKDCARESLAPKTSAPHHTPPKHLPPRPPRMLQGSCKLLLGPARPKEKASPDNLGGRFINTPPAHAQ